ncbi:hypothetical protein, partial [Mycolicibacterium insubricum]|uniref:hypothetical protein n=1 Tax=Mycolicibacterium insubricum TaxID=444597 RepID=UPI003908A673
SAPARFDFSARNDLYTAYLPFAVAGGVAAAWAAKYRQETGETLPPRAGCTAAAGMPQRLPPGSPQLLLGPVVVDQLTLPGVG